jgi:hypothetical protein
MFLEIAQFADAAQKQKGLAVDIKVSYQDIRRIECGGVC